MSSSANPRARGLARQLLACEAGAAEPIAGNGSPAQRVCEKIRRPLTTLAGAGGFCSLLSRALSLAKAGSPWLKTVGVRADGTIEGLNAAEEPLSAAVRAQGELLLVTQLLVLLMTFIGEALTLRLLQSEWPKQNLNYDSAEGNP